MRSRCRSGVLSIILRLSTVSLGMSPFCRVFTDTLRIPPGTCPTLKRCCTTRRSWPSPTSPCPRFVVFCMLIVAVVPVTACVGAHFCIRPDIPASFWLQVLHRHANQRVRVSCLLTRIAAWVVWKTCCFQCFCSND